MSSLREFRITRIYAIPDTLLWPFSYDFPLDSEIIDTLAYTLNLREMTLDSRERRDRYKRYREIQFFFWISFTRRANIHAYFYHRTERHDSTIRSYRFRSWSTERHTWSDVIRRWRSRVDIIDDFDKYIARNVVNHVRLEKQSDIRDICKQMSFRLRINSGSKPKTKRESSSTHRGQEGQQFHSKEVEFKMNGVIRRVRSLTSWCRVWRDGKNT